MPRKSKKPATGQLLVKKGVITPEHLREGLIKQKSSHLPLSYILMKMGYCSFDDIFSAEEKIGAKLTGAAADKKLGEALIKRGIITREQLSEAQENQKNTVLPLGMVFEQLGYVGEFHLFSHLIPVPAIQKKSKKNNEKKKKNHDSV